MRVKRMSAPLEETKRPNEFEAYVRELSPAIMEISPDSLVVVDWNGNICLVNTRTELIFGYSRSELLGKPVEMLLPEDARNIHATTHRDNYRHDPRIREMGANLILRARAKDGEEFLVKVMLAPFTFPHGRFVSAWIRRTD